nr:ATP-binding protein [Pseudomaricurvus alcaniphilus]
MRHQLALLSLVVISLPWAGCQFVREADQTLRLSQVAALRATAQAAAASLSADPALVANLAGERWQQSSAQQLYVHRLVVAPVVDGYADDWRALPIQARTFSDQADGGGAVLALRLALQGEHLFIFAEVDDTTPVHHSPASQLLAAGDFLLLRVGAGDSAQDYVIRSGAPGEVLAFYRDKQGRERSESRIRGYWQERVGGYQVELQMARDLLGNAGHLDSAGHVESPGRGDNIGPLDKIEQLGVAAVDRTGLADRSGRWLGNIDSAAPAPPLIVPAEPLAAALQAFARADVRLRLVSANQWLLAASGSIGEAGRDSGNRHWPLQRLYRLLLADKYLPELDRPESVGLLQAPEVVAALQGQPTVRWYQWRRQRESRLAVPIVSAGEARPVAVLVADQGSSHLDLLALSAFRQLLLYNFLAVGLITLSLLGYSSWLSLRIRRLSKAVRNALDRRGWIKPNFPRSRAADEIGDLSRSCGDLLLRLDDYNDYLRSLAGKLSHELRTPLAVMRSSLENLEHEELPASARTFVDRAGAGAERMAAILAAMSSASRVEESLRQAEKEYFSLAALVREAGAAYQQLYPRHQLRVVIDAAADAAQVYGVPDLLVQLLDKLLENAADFCPAGGEICLQLRDSNRGLILSVSNDGPPLPLRMEGQLFDSLVSVREGGEASDGVHLGLGLHIVRLIAEFHGAAVVARDRSDASGVSFEVVFSAAG